MRRFRDWPLQLQISGLMVGTSILFMLITCSVLAFYEMHDYRTTLQRNAVVLADAIAINSHAALTFDDADGAKSTLAAAAASPKVLAARIFTAHGAPFAEYRQAGSHEVLPTSLDPTHFPASGLCIIRPIDLEGRHLGAIYLHMDTSGVRDRLAVFASASLLVLAGSLLIVVPLSRLLQRPVTEPMLRLASVVKTITHSKDFALRVPVAGKDEVGELSQSVNEMLVQIESQNQALVEGEERLRAVLDSALIAVVVTDATGLVLDWNPRAAAMFGWEGEEMRGQSIEAHLPTAGAAVPGRAGFARATQDVFQRSVETTVLRRTGELVPVELGVTRLKLGATEAICAFLTDITERRQAQVRLQEQLTRLDLLQRITRAIGERLDLASIFQVVIRNLEDNLPLDFICICSWDAVSQRLKVTNVGVRTAQLAMELSLPVAASIPIDQNGLSRCVHGSLVYEGDITNVPFPFPQRLAKAGLCAMVAAPLIVESTVFGIMLIARKAKNSFSSADCEFLRQLSEHAALASHQAQLYNDLHKAYEELRLTQQSVMQQERLRALGQMASGIAHDINNAISPVSLYTESLLETEPGLSPKAKNYLETIKRAIEDVAHTVSRMREFYRQREPQMDLVPVDLNQMIADVLDLTRARWSDMPQQRGIVITVQQELSQERMSARGVASEIREALINLVFNAIDAMPDGGTLTLRTRPVAPSPTHPGHRVAVEVSDSGIGMDEATRRRCLEPFFTTKGERGTGLGLAMVYGVAQRHNAELEITSSPGHGTTMALLFPAAEATAMHPVPGETPLPTRLRLLVVDDDPVLLKSLRDILEGDGHQVTTADQGRSGIERFVEQAGGEERFHLVITDLGMPYVDGRKVASAVKAAAPRTPVILLTGWGQRLIAENDIPEHVDCVLPKPPKLRDLRAALARLCTTDGA